MNLSLEEHITGQRLMIGFDGLSLNQELEFMIRTCKIGGIILFSRNIAAPDQIKELCLSVQAVARSAGQPPLFIAIDQEGGQVARLKPPFTQFPGNPFLKDVEDARYFATVTAAELNSIGVNMNMAPVMDVPPEGFQSVMDGRVFGKNPEWVASLGTTIITELQHKGIMAVAKHFPGIGRTTLDSHIHAPVVNESLEILESTDLLPFQAAIQGDVAAVMLSHICYESLDPEWPASHSKQVVTGLLRGKMGFKGVVITDDLDMGAIGGRYDIHTSIQRIVEADIDIALICHQGPNIQIAFEEMQKCLADSHDARQKGFDSLNRILALKKRFLQWDPHSLT